MPKCSDIEKWPKAVEHVGAPPWPTRRATKDAVADYIEGFYNPY